MYLVVSLDFGGTSDVVIHAFTGDIEKAREVYESVRKRHPELLVEAVDLVEDFQGTHSLFWGKMGAKVVASNNR